ncbi:MAG: hypothetical protein ACPL88_06775, partial [Bryobacteraceae bacterium]
MAAALSAWDTTVLLAAVKAARLSLYVSSGWNPFVELLIEALGRAISDNEHDPEIRANSLWFGRRLKPFLLRVLRERPAAARAILQFLATYIRDVYRRTGQQEIGAITPSTVVIEPTDRCNLNCPGCYAKSTADGADLPYERMVQIVEQVI